MLTTTPIGVPAHPSDEGVDGLTIAGTDLSVCDDPVTVLSVLLTGPALYGTVLVMINTTTTGIYDPPLADGNFVADESHWWDSGACTVCGLPVFTRPADLRRLHFACDMALRAHVPVVAS